MCAAEGGVAVERGSEVFSPHMSRAVPGLELMLGKIKAGEGDDRG